MPNDSTSSATVPEMSEYKMRPSDVSTTLSDAFLAEIIKEKDATIEKQALQIVALKRLYKSK